MIPILPGVLPFGLIMGSVATNAGFSFTETMGLNVLVFAGAAQLASIELMTQNASSSIIILTGLVINLRFLLYSAASSVYLKNENWILKLIGSYLLTDQSYAVTSANESKLETTRDKVQFMFGCALCMALSWHFFVILGISFGNFIPKELSIDFAVPLSFISLTLPSLVSRSHYLIALFSLLSSIFLFQLPYNLGLIITATISIIIAYIFFVRGKK